MLQLVVTRVMFIYCQKKWVYYNLIITIIILLKKLKLSFGFR